MFKRQFKRHLSFPQSFSSNILIAKKQNCVTQGATIISTKMEEITNLWSNLENFVGHNVPMFLKLLLWRCGYDCMLSVKEITNETIDKLENYIEKNKNRILCKVMADLL